MKHKLVAAVVKRQEERYSLNVVPMKVGEKKRGLNGLLAKFILQALAQPAHPAAAIDRDREARSSTDLAWRHCRQVSKRPNPHPVA